MARTAVTQKPLVLLTLQENQVQETVAEDAAEEILQEEEVTKDVAGEEGTSIAQHKHHQ